MSAKRHKHQFSAFWWHFGPYGPQDAHVHSCFTDDCWRVVIGEGRECDVSNGQRHYRATLTEDGPKARASA